MSKCYNFDIYEMILMLQFPGLPILPRSAQALVRWGGKYSIFWLLTFLVTLMPKSSKALYVCQSH